MKIEYGKLNLLILVLAVFLLGMVIFVVNRYYIFPIQEEKQMATRRLHQAVELRNAMVEKADQLYRINDTSHGIEDLSTLIPFGDLHPERLLATLAEVAALADVVLMDQRVGGSVPVIPSNEEEGFDETENQDRSQLLKAELTLNLIGDDEGQFQEFIDLLEQESRLIQVVGFTLNQTRPVPIDEESDLDQETEDTQQFPENNDPKSMTSLQEISAGGSLELADENAEQTDSEELVDIEESEESNEEERLQVIPQTRNMTANIRLVVYFVK